MSRNAPSQGSSIAAAVVVAAELVHVGPALAQRAECSTPIVHGDELQVVHCRQCGTSNVSGKESPIVLPGSFTMPAFATRATVFQNGWRLSYLNGSHKITTVRAFVQDIRRSGQTLLWNSEGILRDQNFDDGYEFCSTYTILAWDENKVKIAVDHADKSAHPLFKADGLVESDREDGSALLSLELFRENPANPSSLPQPVAAVLPRGFDFFFSSHDVFPPCFDPAGDPAVGDKCKDDNDLLQLAFHKDHAEGFAPRGAPDNADGPGRVDTTVVGWTTYGIMKDNATKRDVRFATAASTLGGEDVRAIEPPFSIRPRDDPSGCLTPLPSGDGVVTTEVVIERVPFEVAVPVLSGWNIGYQCEDDDVQDIGVWIESFEYTRQILPFEQGGTLRYRIARSLRNASADQAFKFDHIVDILGIGPVIIPLGPDGGVIQPN
jgi:hypothetical protein